MKYTKSFSLLLLILLCGGCASIFIPNKQKVTIQTNNPDARVLVNGKEFGNGETVKKRIKKQGTLQVTVLAPGSKPDYYVILPHRRPVFFWAMQPLNILTLGYGYIFDFYLGETNISYRRTYSFNRNNTQLTYRDTASDKYLRFDSLTAAPEDPDLNFLMAYVKHSADQQIMEERMLQAENFALNAAQEKRISSKKTKTKIPKVVGGPFYVGKDQVKNTGSVNELLSTCGFRDSSITDPSLTLHLQAQILNGTCFVIAGRKGDDYRRMKLNTRWYLMSGSGELIDSTDILSYSGDMFLAGSGNLEDALANSFLLLQDTDLFKTKLKKEPAVRKEPDPK